MLENNKVSIVGTICEKLEFEHEAYGKAFFKSKVRVKRLSGVEDILPISIPERLLFSGEQYIIGSRVKIDGQFRSMNKLTSTGSKLILFVFARDICLTDEEVDANDCDLTGYLCKPVQYRTTPFEREVSDLLIAVNRQYNRSDYIPAIAWGRNARFAESLEIGQGVKVHGRIQSRAYQKKWPNGLVEDRIAYELSTSLLEVVHA